MQAVLFGCKNANIPETVSSSSNSSTPVKESMNCLLDFVLVFWAPSCSTAVGFSLQVWIRNPGPDSLPKTPAEPGLDGQPAHRPVESVPVAVCLPSLLNLNNSKGSYTEGQLWYCVFPEAEQDQGVGITEKQLSCGCEKPVQNNGTSL